MSATPDFSPEAIAEGGGENFTPEEMKAIRSLERLAARWPESLMLFSASGSLHVMTMADYGTNTFLPSRCHGIIGISNDGGDPDWTHEDAN